MAVQSVPTLRIPKREPQVLVEYQRETSFPWMVMGVYSNSIVADKAIKRLSRLMPGSPNFRTR